MVHVSAKVGKKALDKATRTCHLKKVEDAVTTLPDHTFENYGDNKPTISDV